MLSPSKIQHDEFNIVQLISVALTIVIDTFHDALKPEPAPTRSSTWSPITPLAINKELVLLTVPIIYGTGFVPPTMKTFPELVQKTGTLKSALNEWIGSFIPNWDMFVPIHVVPFNVKCVPLVEMAANVSFSGEAWIFLNLVSLSMISQV